MVMETVINKRHLERNSLMSDHQFGFRYERSTADFLCLVTDKMYQSLERHGETNVIAADISKAFDRVWHLGIASKFPSYVYINPPQPGPNLFSTITKFTQWLTVHSPTFSKSMPRGISGICSGSHSVPPPHQWPNLHSCWCSRRSFPHPYSLLRRQH